MNRLDTAKRVQILSMLCEGAAMRAVARVVDVSFNTVNKLLIDAGLACARFHDENVRGVKARRIQSDEIWSFCYAKAKNVPTAKAALGRAGDVWTWTALDSDSKLIVSYLIGGRDSEYAKTFMDDVRTRLAHRVQLTTDGHKAYLSAVEEASGDDVDYDMLVKLYGETPEAQKRCGPAECIGIRKDRITGNPDRAHVSTSHVERSSLSLRMHMRRFTCLTNAHSKKFENHCHMVALYTVWYNFARINSAVRMSPAMAAGISDRLLSMADIVAIAPAKDHWSVRAGEFRLLGTHTTNTEMVRILEHLASVCEQMAKATSGASARDRGIHPSDMVREATAQRWRSRESQYRTLASYPGNALDRLMWLWLTQRCADLAQYLEKA